MVLVWQITEDLPNSPNFPSPAKHSHYTVDAGETTPTKLLNAVPTLFTIQNKYRIHSRMQKREFLEPVTDPGVFQPSVS